jgi:hypothetical protein
MRSNPNFEKPTQRFFEKKQAKITKRSSSNPLRESPNQFYNVKTGIRQRFGLKRRTEPKTSKYGTLLACLPGKKRNTR